MADIVTSLFGLAPIRQEAEMAARARDLDLGTLIGQATVNQYAPLERQRAYIAQQGAQAALGGAAIRGLGSLFGLQDPMLQRATQLESILGETQAELGEMANDPTQFYPTLQNKLANAGFTREAMMAGQAGQKAMQEWNLGQAKLLTEQAQYAKATREANPALEAWKSLAAKSTPESVDASRKAGFDPRLLVLANTNVSVGEAYTNAVTTLNDPNATPAQKEIAQKNYQMLFPAATSGALGQYIPTVQQGQIGVIPIPGSPEAAKKATEARKGQGRLTAQWNKSEVIKQAVDDALPLITEKTAGSVGEITRAIPFTGSSDAATLQKTIDTIKANIGFDQLDQMRQNSPTGGALGQVAVQELNYLQAALGSLDAGLPPEILKRNLKRVQEHYVNFMNELEKEMEAAQQGQKTTPNVTGSQRTKVLDGVTYIEVSPGKWKVGQ